MAVFGSVSLGPTAKGPQVGMTYPQLGQSPTPDLYVLEVIK